MKERITKYDGPDGAKRLEMLEKMARFISQWRSGRIDWDDFYQMALAVDQDNRRVDRLKDE